MCLKMFALGNWEVVIKLSSSVEDSAWGSCILDHFALLILQFYTAGGLRDASRPVKNC